MTALIKHNQFNTITRQSISLIACNGPPWANKYNLLISSSEDFDVNVKQSCFIVAVTFDGHIKVLTFKEGSTAPR